MELPENELHINANRLTEFTVDLQHVPHPPLFIETVSFWYPTDIKVVRQPQSISTLQLFTLHTKTLYPHHENLARTTVFLSR